MPVKSKSKPKPKLNLKPRLRKKLYRVEPLFAGPGESLRVEGIAAVLAGELEGVRIVSVPASVPTHVAEELHKTLQARWPGRELLVVTHNVEFLQVRPCSAGDYRRVEERKRRDVAPSSAEVS